MRKTPVITPEDKRKYVLKEKKDYTILAKVKHLEQLTLSITDKKMVQLIKTQLKKDWRTPLLKYLSCLEKRYR